MSMYDVVALGELLIDFTTQSTDSDGYPTMAAHPGGAPANFLAAIAKFGGRAALLGKVGTDTFGKLLTDTLRKAGIETKITPHMFRHSFATYLIEEGVDVSCVQQILGHSSIKTTQIYIHVAAKKQADILRELHPRNNMKIVNVA